MGIAGLTAALSLRKRAARRPGETVLVSGASGRAWAAQAASPNVRPCLDPRA